MHAWPGRNMWRCSGSEPAWKSAGLPACLLACLPACPGQQVANLDLKKGTSKHVQVWMVAAFIVGRAEHV